jgi:hypothetical protein
MGGNDDWAWARLLLPPVLDHARCGWRPLARQRACAEGQMERRLPIISIVALSLS